MIPEGIPTHLRRFIVEQDYSQYTAVNQATWRFLLRQLRSYLAEHGHACYLKGLDETGITTDEIPRVKEISRCLERYGWRAVGVSGFIPPSAFMELQAIGILPIGTVMRTLEHILYTPAPDIVHEAAGHAPILIHADFSSYLHKYAHAARRAIFFKEDLDLYEAIRALSDIKEHPSSTDDDIAAAEKALEDAAKNISEPSEANLLGRLNWWTAEYGLIGDEKTPKIYGAGLLSSLGEANWCRRDAVKKLPMSLKCIDYNYDITEPQPQLFVTPSFDTLITVINELADTMAFRCGGIFGLKRIKRARTVNTIEYNSGLQVSGQLKDFIEVPSGAIYVQFEGPVQLSYHDAELKGHGTTRHAEGFGSPVGLLEGTHKCLSECSKRELEQHGMRVGHHTTLCFTSGVKVEGKIKGILHHDARNLLVTFTDCRVTYRDQTLFDPSWGEYDMAVGESLPSIFGGAADREKYGELESFAVKHVPPYAMNPEEEHLNALYARVRHLRKSKPNETVLTCELTDIVEALDDKHPDDWLLRLEIFELTQQMDSVPPFQSIVARHLQQRVAGGDELGLALQAGLDIAMKPKQ